MPATQIKYQKELEVARGICEVWKKKFPEEVAAWRRLQEDLSQAYEWTGGWSESKELLALEQAPAYVVLGIGRGLQLLGWPQREAKDWDRQLEGNRYVPSDLWKMVIRELLPEARVVRKERVLRSHQGVEFPAS